MCTSPRGHCCCSRVHEPQAAHVAQVNGGTVEEKVDFAHKMFEKSVRVDSVFQENEMIDTIAITRGRGTEGVVTRWGVSRLPRKTHRGLRKARALAHSRVCQHRAAGMLAL